MKLQEFIKLNDPEGYVKDQINKLYEHVASGKSFVDPEESRYQCMKADSCYDCIHGFIMAAFSYGRITWEEYCSLIDELMDLRFH